MSIIGETSKDIQEVLAKKFNYGRLPELLSLSIRRFYKSTLAGQDWSDTDCELYTWDDILVAKSFNRIVIGDYGAFVEILDEDMIKENLIIKKGEEYRINDPKYSKNVKYAWWTVKDSIYDIKVYQQKRTVTYANYVVGRWYIDPHDLLTRKKVSDE